MMEDTYTEKGTGESYQAGKRENLPLAVTEQFQVESLLHESERTKTWRIRKKDNGRRYIVKVRPVSERGQTEREEEILRLLEENGIAAPRFFETIHTEEESFFIREYIEGETLEEYEERRGGFSETELISIGMMILEKLRILHELPNPVIHRDIKPKNILLTGEPDSAMERDIVLIDYDAARFYKENAESDTVHLGTKQTAAPEQYGFAQSDVRTDIYGVGKTLIRLATGSYNERLLKNSEYSSELQELLLRCVSIDKEDRPASAEKMYRELKAMKKKQRFGKKRNQGKFIAVAVVLTGVLLFFGIWFERSRIRSNDRAETGNKSVSLEKSEKTEETEETEEPEEDESVEVPVHAPTEEVDFSGSVTLEKAVRTSLQKKENEKITYGDLEKITVLSIVGKHAFRTTGSYLYTGWDLFRFQPDGNEERYENVAKGDITDISLLAYMKNLHSVVLAHQYITDIRVLRNLPIEDLAITDCPVEDYRVIGKISGLKKLGIFCNQEIDLNFLKDLKDLYELDLGMVRCISLKPLEQTKIRMLRVFDITAEDESYSAFHGMKLLREFEGFQIGQEVVGGLKNHDHLDALILWRVNLTEGLSVLGSMRELEHLDIGDCVMPSMKGIENFPNVGTLFLPRSEKDFSGLFGLKQLRYINFAWCNIKDYSGLFLLSGITQVACKEYQKEEILKLQKNPSFEFEITD